MAERGFWDKLSERVQEGFMPAAARAEKAVKEKREMYGNQLDEDMKLSPEERAAKIRKGFLKRVHGK